MSYLKYCRFIRLYKTAKNLSEYTLRVRRRYKNNDHLLGFVADTLPDVKINESKWILLDYTDIK
jgi:hypothetical protein